MSWQKCKILQKHIISDMNLQALLVFATLSGSLGGKRYLIQTAGRITKMGRVGPFQNKMFLVETAEKFAGKQALAICLNPQ